MPMDNGLEMSRPASAPNLRHTRFAAAGRVGSIELLGGRLRVLTLDGGTSCPLLQPQLGQCFLDPLTIFRRKTELLGSL
jgi:hypothetical protein